MRCVEKTIDSKLSNNVIVSDFHGFENQKFDKSTDSIFDISTDMAQSKILKEILLGASKLKDDIVVLDTKVNSLSSLIDSQLQVKKQKKKGAGSVPAAVDIVNISDTEDEDLNSLPEFTENDIKEKKTLIRCVCLWESKSTYFCDIPQSRTYMRKLEVHFLKEKNLKINDTADMNFTRVVGKKTSVGRDQRFFALMCISSLISSMKSGSLVQPGVLEEDLKLAFEKLGQSASPLSKNFLKFLEVVFRKLAKASGFLLATSLEELVKRAIDLGLPLQPAFMEDNYDGDDFSWLSFTPVKGVSNSEAAAVASDDDISVLNIPSNDMDDNEDSSKSASKVFKFIYNQINLLGFNSAIVCFYRMQRELRGHQIRPVRKQGLLGLLDQQRRQRNNSLFFKFISVLINCIQGIFSFPCLTLRIIFVVFREMVFLISLIRKVFVLKGAKFASLNRHLINLQSDLMSALILTNNPNLPKWMKNVFELVKRIDYDSYFASRDKNDKCSVVYLITSFATKAKYVGETERGTFERFKEHLYKSSKCQEGKNSKFDCLLGRKMASVGCDTFMIIPIWFDVRFGSDFTQIRKLKEKMLIHAIGANLNKKFKKWYIPANINRPLIHNRKSNKKELFNKVSNSVKPKFYVFRCNGKYTNDLADFFDEMIDGEVKIVDMKKGIIDLSRIVVLSSAIFLVGNKWRSLYKGALWKKSKCDLRLIMKKVVNKHSDSLLESDKLDLVVKLIRHPHTKKSFLKKIGNVGIRDLIVLASSHLVGINKARVISVLKSYLIKSDGGVDLPKMVLKCGGSDEKFASYLKNFSRRMIERTKVTSLVKRYLDKECRVVAKKPITLGSLIINDGKFAKKFKRDTFEELLDKCTCGNQSKGKSCVSMSLHDFLGLPIEKCRSDSIPTQRLQVKDLLISLVNFSNSLRLWKTGLSRFQIKGNKLYEKGDFVRVLLEDDFYVSKKKKIQNDEILFLVLQNLKKMGSAKMIFHFKMYLRNVIEKQEKDVNSSFVNDLRKKLKGLIVSHLDKGGKTIYVQCQKLHLHGVKKFILEEKNLELRLDFSIEKANNEIKNLYEACGLNAVLPFRLGRLPSMRVNPKFKDPVNKYRVITSYYHFSMKKLLKCCGKVLRFMLKEVHSHGLMSSFTLFNMKDFKERILKVKNFVDRKKVMMWQSDVKCMFTNLSKESILRRVNDLINLFTNLHRSKPKGISILKVAPYTCYIGTNVGVDGLQVLDFDVIRRIVMWDLSSTYCSFGDMVFYQKEGIPIGGMCSSIYADIQCGFDEYDCIKNFSADELRSVIGIRQIDDLLLLTTDESLKDRILKCYDDGLELETNSIEKGDDGKQRTVFIGLDVTLFNGCVNANVSNINKESLVKYSKQLKPRFVLPSMHRGSSLDKQVITGCLFRVRDYSIGGNQIVKGVMDFAYEFSCIGHDKSLFKSVLKNFVKRHVELHRRKSWDTSMAKF